MDMLMLKYHEYACIYKNMKYMCTVREFEF